MSKPPNSVPHTSSLRWVLIEDIQVDNRAQRDLRPGWVKSRVKDFDPEQLGYIVVNKRSDGKWYAIDGQHRVALLREAGWGDQQVQCEAYEGLTLQQEAELFLARNDRIAVRTFDKFRVAVTAGELGPCEIDRICRAQNLTVSDRAHDGHVVAVAALTRIHKGAGINPKDGPGALARTLRTVQQAWGRQVSSFNGTVLEGIGMAQLRYNGSIEQETLIQKLAAVPGGAPGLLGRAAAMRDIRGSSLASCLAGVVVDVYNKGRQKGKGALEDWWS